MSCRRSINELSHAPTGRCCHPERSEGSLYPANQILRCAQDDSAGLILRGVYPELSEALKMTGPALVLKLHHHSPRVESLPYQVVIRRCWLLVHLRFSVPVRWW